MTEEIDPRSPESRRWQDDFENAIEEISQGNYVPRLTRGHAFEACQLPEVRRMGAAAAAKAYWSNDRATYPWIAELSLGEDYH